MFQMIVSYKRKLVIAEEIFHDGTMMPDLAVAMSSAMVVARVTETISETNLPVMIPAEV